MIGGRGGRGNRHFSSGTNRSPKQREEGQPGEVVSYELELRVIADIGLVGYPNAGKSTLLSVLSNAKPKIANYAFTTLNPYVGIMFHGEHNIRIADIPGLIEGAHANRGLGHQFLQHIERTKILCYVLDMSSDDPAKDFEDLQEELRLYNPDLLTRPSIVIANKMDLHIAHKNLETFKSKAVSKHGKLVVVPVSTLMESNLEEVKKTLGAYISDMNQKKLD